MAFIFLCHGFDADVEVMVCSSTAVLVSAGGHHSCQGARGAV